MPAAQYNFALDRGVDERRTFTWKSGGALVDLTGATAALTLRDARAPNAAPFATLASGGGTPRITLGGVAGTIAVHFAAALLSSRKDEVLAYELRITLANGDVRALLKGAIEVRDDDQPLA